MPNAKPKRGIMDLAVGRSDTYRLDPRLLHIEPSWNSRTLDFDPADPEDLALANSIAEVGVKSAITVYMRDGVPVVTDGHRRLAATLYAIDTLGAEVRSVPVQTEPKQASEADRVLSQIVRNAGKPLAPIEKANVFAKLMDLGWDESQIAKKAGVSRQYVTSLLELRASNRDVVDLVKSGAVSATLASQTIKASGGDGKAAAEALRGGLERARAAGKSRAIAKHVRRVSDVHPQFVAGLRRAVAVVRGAGFSEAAELLESEMGGAHG